MIMKNWMGGIRGAIFVVILWVAGWGLGFGGIMEIVDPDGKIEDVWPTVLATPGLFGGIVFAAILTFVERGRAFAQVSLVRFAVWGIVTGIALGLLTIPAEVGDVSPGAAGMVGIASILGLIAGSGTGLFFRLLDRWVGRNAVP
jgi:hypothetical protein